METFFFATVIFVLLTLGHFYCREVEQFEVVHSHTFDEELTQTLQGVHFAPEKQYKVTQSV